VGSVALGVIAMSITKASPLLLAVFAADAPQGLDLSVLMQDAAGPVLDANVVVESEGQEFAAV
jgi:hypothetical protein